MSTSKPDTDPMSAWLEAQRLMWDGLSNAAQMVGNSQDVYRDMSTQWRTLTDRSMAGWQDGAKMSQDVAGSVVNSQQAMLRFFDMSADAWKTMQAAGGNWQDALKGYSDMQRTMLERMQTANSMTQNMGNLWTGYLKGFSGVAQPWMQTMMNAPAPGDDSSFAALSNAYWHAFDRTLKPYLQSPGLGLTRELDEKLRQGFLAYSELQRANADYNGIMMRLSAKAFETVMKRLTEKAQAGEQVSSLKELSDLWINLSDEVFMEAFRTEEYIRIQGTLLNALMTHRLRERAVTEVFLNAQGLPTRTELDDTYRTIYELRKELRMLKKEVRSIREAQSSSSDETETPAPRKGRGKRKGDDAETPAETEGGAA